MVSPWLLAPWGQHGGQFPRDPRGSYVALHPDIKTGVRGWQGHCLPSQPVHLPGSRQTGSYWSGVSSTPHRSGSTKAGRNAETLPESQQVCVPTGLDLRLWALPSLGLPGSWDFFPIPPLPPLWVPSLPHLPSLQTQGPSSSTWHRAVRSTWWVSVGGCCVAYTPWDRVSPQASWL